MYARHRSFPSSAWSGRDAGSTAAAGRDRAGRSDGGGGDPPARRGGRRAARRWRARRRRGSAPTGGSDRRVSASPARSPRRGRDPAGAGRGAPPRPPAGLLRPVRRGPPGTRPPPASRAPRRPSRLRARGRRVRTRAPDARAAIEAAGAMVAQGPRGSRVSPRRRGEPRPRPYKERPPLAERPSRWRGLAVAPGDWRLGPALTPARATNPRRTTCEPRRRPATPIGGPACHRRGTVAPLQSNRGASRARIRERGAARPRTLRGSATLERWRRV